MKSAASLFFAALAACSPANIASPDGGDPNTTACTNYAFARCHQLATCSPTAVQIRYGDDPTCRALYTGNCLGSLEAPATGTSAASSQACAQAIANGSWTCSDFLFNQNPPPSCGVMAGALAMGAACAFPGQCQSGFCAIPLGRACGTCAAPAKPGDSCANLTTCGPSLVCDAVTSTCEGFAALGAACLQGQPCAAGLNCVGAKVGTPGTCMPSTTTLGDACSFTGAGCELLAGLACNAVTGQCATAHIVGPGLACGIVANQFADCASSGSCVSGACVAGAPIGAACDLANGPGCLDLLRCVVTADGGTAGTCQLPSAATCQ